MKCWDQHNKKGSGSNRSAPEQSHIPGISSHSEDFMLDVSVHSGCVCMCSDLIEALYINKSTLEASALSNTAKRKTHKHIHTDRNPFCVLRLFKFMVINWSGNLF